MRVNPSLMSQRDDTGLLSNRSDRCVRYRVDIVKNLKVTEVSNTGIDVVPMQVPSPVQTSIPVPDVPVLMLYRTCRSVPCRYWCCTENTEVHGIGMKVCTGTGGIGIYIVSNLPRRPVPLIPVVYKAGMPRYVPHRTHPWKIKSGGEINIRAIPNDEKKSRFVIFLSWIVTFFVAIHDKKNHESRHEFF